MMSARRFSERTLERARESLPTLMLVFDRAWSCLLAVALAVPLWRFVSRLPERLSYPFELEWMEGGIVSHIRLLLAGEPLYRAPSLQFTPFIYPPFYYYASALVAKLVGIGYLAPRLVSTLSILGCLALLFVWVWRETRDWLASWACAALFAATYDLGGRWFDVARCDSLLLFFLLAACVCGRFAQRRRAFVLTGVFLALAFFTKQSALSVAGPVLLAALLRVPRRGWIASAVFVSLVGLGVVAHNVATHGWFWYYVFDLPAQHHVEWRAWRQVVFDPTWPALAPMILAGLALTCGVPLLRGGARAWTAGGLLVLCACLGSSAGLLHTGGYINVMMPAYALLSFASGMVVARLRTHYGSAALRHRLLVGALLLLQLGLLSFGESAALPRAGDRNAGARMLESLSRLPGPIWCTSSNFYPVLAGHPESTTHSMGLVDVFKSNDTELKARLLASLGRDLRSGDVRTIVLDPASGFLPPKVVRLIRVNYHFIAHLTPPSGGDALWPNTGAPVRPEEIWSSNVAR